MSARCVGRRPRPRVRDVAAEAFGTVALIVTAAVPFIFWLGGAR